MNETDCNAQDLHNLTVAATKVNQKVCFLAALMGSVVNVWGTAFWCRFCGTTTNGLEMVVQERVWYCSPWPFLALERGCPLRKERAVTQQEATRRS